jgi:hypothetical protein
MLSLPDNARDKYAIPPCRPDRTAVKVIVPAMLDSSAAAQVY